MSVSLHFQTYAYREFCLQHLRGSFTNSICRYKPDVKLRFVTEELGFESDEESARFICDHGGQSFLDEREEGEVRLLTGKALRFFEGAKASAFRTVDIKGQI